MDDVEVVGGVAAVGSFGLDGGGRGGVAVAHVDGMTPEQARELVHAVVERMPRLEIDYVRLNIRARRSGRPSVR